MLRLERLQALNDVLKGMLSVQIDASPSYAQRLIDWSPRLVVSLVETNICRSHIDEDQELRRIDIVPTMQPGTDTGRDCNLGISPGESGDFFTQQSPVLGSPHPMPPYVA